MAASSQSFEASNLVCPDFGTRSGCRKGKRCQFQHVKKDGQVMATRASGLRPFPGWTDILKLYLGVDMPLTAWASRFRSSPPFLSRLADENLQRIFAFVGLPTRLPLSNCHFHISGVVVITLSFVDVYSSVGLS